MKMARRRMKHEERRRMVHTPLSSKIVLLLAVMIVSQGRIIYTEAFVFLPTTSTRIIKDHSWELMLAKSNPNSSQGKKSKGKKPQRFSQTVHKKPKDGEAPTLPLHGRRSFSSSSSSSSPPPSRGALSQETTAPSNDRMWKSSKSIEDLEARLEGRWGTDLRPWTAQDVADYDDDGDDDEGTIIQGGVDTFRGRPVKDPWSDGKEVTQPARKSVFSADASEDPMLRRVRKNQQSIRKNREYSDDYNEYDSSEWQSDSSSESIGVGHLIAAKPAGGKGTKDTGSDRRGFFVQPTEDASSPVSPSSLETVAPDNKRAKTSATTALLDKDGNPIVLSIDQIEKDVRYSRATDESQGDLDSETPTLTKSWHELGISSDTLLNNLKSMECTDPLASQTHACPIITEGKDVLIGTYTGSGKTLAFLVPLVQRILEQGETSTGAGIQLLVVAPGRELASQIISVARELLQDTDITAMLAIGGTTFSRNLEQIRKRKPTILVGTPGRLAELLVGRPGERAGRVKVANLQYLVLDEFDALLQYKPHRDPTIAILQTLNRKRGNSLQSIFCSATATDMLGTTELENWLRPGFEVSTPDDPHVLPDANPDSEQKATRVSRTTMHGVVHVEHKRFALDTVRRILHTEPFPRQVLIFADDSRKVVRIVEQLEAIGIIAAPLHGGMGSEKMDRADVNKALREGYVGIVVATEMAARGLDAPLLTHVINLDLPTDASHYAHRAGRCGRGGRPGVVVNITTDPKERKIPAKFARQLGVPMYTVDVKNGKLNVIDPSSQDL